MGGFYTSQANRLVLSLLYFSFFINLSSSLPSLTLFLSRMFVEYTRFGSEPEICTVTTRQASLDRPISQVGVY